MLFRFWYICNFANPTLMLGKPFPFVCLFGKIAAPQFAQHNMYVVVVVVIILRVLCEKAKSWARRHHVLVEAKYLT